MTIYFLKAMLCSAAFLAIYKLFLENEKMLRFNRLYLLFSIIFSFVVPFVSFQTTATVSIDEPVNIVNNNIISTFTPLQHSASNELNIFPVIISSLYIFITCFLLYRFIKNIITIYKKINNNRRLSYFNATLVLTKDSFVPHSFLKYIFLNEEEFEKGSVEKEILDHELAHVTQKHSLDILFIEILLILNWFNPVLYLYKKAIRLNHEFLADESVIKTYHNPSSYLTLLLKEISKPGDLLLASQFNYSATKKRFIMITKITSRRIAIIKQIAVVPLFVAALLLLSSRGYTQVKINEGLPEQTITYGTGATQDELNEYDSIARKMNSIKIMPNGAKASSTNLSMGNVDRLAFIYAKMTKDQCETRTSMFGFEFKRPFIAPIKKYPSAAQLKSWAIAKNYGIWIDGKRIDNDALDNYNATDFVFFNDNKLMKYAQVGIYYGQDHQVDLFTAGYYDTVYGKKSK